MSKKTEMSTVSLPITGTITFEVSADNDEEAIKAAWEMYGGRAEGELYWEACDQIVEGNVFCGVQNKTVVD